MDKIRLWAFPVGLILAWMLAAAYTISLLIDQPRQGSPEQDPLQTIQSVDEPV